MGCSTAFRELICDTQQFKTKCFFSVLHIANVYYIYVDVVSLYLPSIIASLAWTSWSRIMCTTTQVNNTANNIRGNILTVHQRINSRPI